jgi:hypothetical protein
MYRPLINSTNRSYTTMTTNSDKTTVVTPKQFEVLQALVSGAPPTDVDGRVTRKLVENGFLKKSTDQLALKSTAYGRTFATSDGRTLVVPLS